MEGSLISSETVNNIYNDIVRYCELYNVSMKFDFSQFGPSHMPVFNCTCVLSRNNLQKTINIKGFYNKKDCKKRIREILVHDQQIIKEIYPSNINTNNNQNFNQKELDTEFSKIEKYLAINQINLDYKFSDKGSLHDPTLKCMCSISKKNKIMNLDSDIHKTKNDCKKQIKQKIIENINLVKENFPTNFLKELHWNEIQVPDNIKLYLFTEPPDTLFSHNYLKNNVIGIDFEGCPPCLAQICCESGILIDSFNSPIVQRILNDKNLIHVIFREHEKNLVRNPFDIQVYLKKLFPTNIKQWSLADGVSLVLELDTIFIKDKTIHKRHPWKKISESKKINKESLRYAKNDAWISYLLGINLINV